MKKRRAFEVFTLSFLDCICCGFGAVVLFYTIVQAHVGAQEIIRIDQLTGEVRKLEEEVKEGTKNLVLLRNTLEKTDQDADAARARALRVAAELKERSAQSSIYEDESLARREHINQLKADIKSLEEGIKRLQGGALDKAPAGDRVKSFRGRGNRKYISALQIKGKRILVLLDTSASMMDEDVAKVIKMRNQPEPMRRAAQKWRRSLDMVEWITAQLPDNSKFQVIGFNTKAKVVQANTAGQWLDSNDPRAINGVVYRIAIFYVGSVLLLTMLLPWDHFTGTESPFVTVFSALGIPAVGDIMNAVVLTAALSSCNSGLYSTGRILRSLAQKGEAPAFTGKMNSRHVPYGGILFTGAAYLFGVVLNYIVPKDAFDIAIAIASLGVVSTWATLIICQMRLRQKALKGEVQRPSYRMPGAPYTSWLTLAFLGLVVGQMAFSSGHAERIAFWSIPVLALVLFVGWRFVKSRQPVGQEQEKLVTVS